MGKLTLALVLCVVAVYSQAATSKVSLGVQQQLRVPGAAPKIMVIFKENAAIRAQFKHQTFANKVDKRVALFSSLKAFAASTQKSAIALLNSNAKTASAYKAFWITNRIFVDGADAATIAHLAGLPEVVEIREQKIAHISPAVKSGSTILAEWGIENTNAPEVHSAGITGEGVVVSSIDTGVLYTHEALNANYRNDGYSWYDPYSGSANPIDSNGHGTHTMGTIAGSHDIGMAPGSKWIACRGCDTSSCTENALLSCGEFIACPHGPNGGACDASKTPDVVNNSWGGGQGDAWFDDIIDSWIQAGVVPVFSNGNSGAYCGTANSPADNTDVIGVGSTDVSNTLSYFSSCGPAQNGGHIKPDISAPGSDVRSASNSGNNQYETMSGTSMAGPHVAGAVALFLQDNPNATLEQVKLALYQNTNRFGLGAGAGTCSGIPESQFPNHSYGYGILDIAASINNAK